MSKYKVGDKVVYEVKEIIRDNVYLLSGWKESEPLSTYTEPLERKNENKQKQIEKLVDKLHRQATEITRLLAENKELKEDKAVLNAKIDAYELYGDQHEEEYNQAFNQGAETAWELARKIILYDKDSYSGEELKEIFGYAYSQTIMKNYTYQLLFVVLHH